MITAGLMAGNRLLGRWVGWLLYGGRLNGGSTLASFDTGAAELRAWRQDKIELVFDAAGPLLFGLAVRLTGSRDEAEAILVRSFKELSHETSVLAGVLPKIHQWLAGRIVHHCLRSQHATPAMQACARKRIGREVFTILSRSPGWAG